MDNSDKNEIKSVVVFYLRGSEILEEIIILDGFFDQSSGVEILLNFVNVQVGATTNTLTGDTLLLVESNLARNTVAVLAANNHNNISQ